MSLSRFATAKQIASVALIWAAVLCAAEYIKAPRPLMPFADEDRAATAFVNVDKPRITLLMKHLCCSGCLDELVEALRGLSWIGAVTVLEDVKEKPHGALASEERWVSLAIVDAGQVDIVALDRAVRGTGLAAEQIVVEGLKHFRLEAEVGHVCCDTCAAALDKGLDQAKSLPSMGRLRWIDSVRVSKEKKTVTLFARYGRSVDVSALIAAFNSIGFSPRALRVLSGDGS